MRSPHALLVVALGLVVAPVSGVSAENPRAKSPPTVVVQVKPVDAFFDDVKFVIQKFAQAAKPGSPFKAELAKIVPDIEADLGAVLGPVWRKAVDTKAPFGLYARLTPKVEESTLVFLLPVQDRNAFVKTLAKLGFPVEKKADGFYEVAIPDSPFPFLLRFMHGHAYLSQRTAGPLADDQVLRPGEVFTDGEQAALTARVRLDQVPGNLPRVLAPFLDLLADQVVPAGTDMDPKLRGPIVQLIRKWAGWCRLGLEEGKDLSFRLDFDRATLDLNARLVIDGKPGSKLAAGITALKPLHGVTAGVTGSDSAVSARLTWSLPQELREYARVAFGHLLDGISEGEKAGAEPGSGKALRKQLQDGFKDLEGALASDLLELSISLRGPNKKGQYTYVAGLQLRDGAAAEMALRKMVKALPDVPPGILVFDSTQAGSYRLHRFNLPNVPEPLVKVFGDSAFVFAFRKDAFFVAAGAEAKQYLAEALNATPAARPAEFRVDFAPERLADLLTHINPGRDRQEWQWAFGPLGKRARVVDLSMRGGNKLEVRFSANLPVLAGFVVAVGQTQSKTLGGPVEIRKKR